MSVRPEQELTSDGRLIGIARWAKALKGKPAIWDQQAGVALILNEPKILGVLKDDAVGLGFNWAKENEDAREEFDIELFYRFPLFQNVDFALAYQYVVDPANARSATTGRYIVTDGFVFSLRIRATF